MRSAKQHSAKHLVAIFICTLFCLPAVPAQGLQQQPQGAASSEVTIIIQQDKVRFTAQKAVAEMRLQVFNQAGESVFDSGAIEATEVNWPLQAINGETLKSGLYAYTLSIKEAGAAEARLRRGHFIVDRAKDRDGADRLWVTSQSESGVGTELTVAKDEAATIAGAAISNGGSERTVDQRTEIVGRDAAGRTIEAETQGKAKAEKSAAPNAPNAPAGTVGQIAKFTSANGVGDSLISESNGGVQLPNNVQLGVGAQGNQVAFGSPNGETGMSISGATGRADVRFDGTTLRLLAGPAGGPPSNGIAITSSNAQLPNNVSLGVGPQGNNVAFGSPNSETGMTISGAGGRADLRFNGTLKLLNGPGGIPPQTNGIAITTAGNVGVGTVTPETKLHVGGDYLRVDGKGNEQVYIGGDGVGNDAQLGSSNPSVTDVVLWNRTTNKYMKLNTSSVAITGGSDFAENFEVNAAPETGRATMPKIAAGMVVSIDPAHPGKLKLSAHAYDRRVAGIISGAGGVQPGMTMGQEKTLADGKHPVALSGRVYVWVDATRGAIRPGDLLTTSATAGHAMKASNPAKAQGAIIGKAMTGLKSGKGLVLVLVTLQ